MKEYFTEAIVLDKEDLGEADSRVFLYTENFGKVVAKAKSSRKITSKLAGHLEPLNLIATRLITLKDFQIVDALSIDKLKSNDMVKIMGLVKEIGMENQPDQLLWQFLRKQFQAPPSAGECAAHILKIAGFDPHFATCQACNAAAPKNFLLNSAEYLCSPCLQLAGNERHFKLELADAQGS